MILFFGDASEKIFAVQTPAALPPEDVQKLTWLFGNQPLIEAKAIDGPFIGPRAAMISPWSTNAVDITQNMGIRSLQRIEEFVKISEGDHGFDPMLTQRFEVLDQRVYAIDVVPEPIKEIDDIQAYNEAEGLALSMEEVHYLEGVATRIGRPLTDSEVFGFSQVNSEHCRHKIFNGTFVIDGIEQPSSLFALIKETSKAHPNGIVSAYRDNVAFVDGPSVVQFAPTRSDIPDYYEKKEVQTVLSLKAETHNFPTTVEPFNGAATGSGGEIRDRLAGGKGSLPLAGTAVYMTAYPRHGDDRPWLQGMTPRPWLYQTPLDILIKASDGASDFGNKFGQPLIAGSLLTFEHQEHDRKLAYDKVIMLAGGVGYGRSEQAAKGEPSVGDRIVVLGGDNYRIGMGGAAVSSADTGEFSTGLELNAVQRSNPEMQKRVANVIRGLAESEINPIVSIHDHGAGGHLNCLSELVEDTGGAIDLDQLPVGDPTLSAKEIIGNESQERMGLVIAPEDMPTLRRVSERERSPIYDVGVITGDHRFSFRSGTNGAKPMDLDLADMFGSSPKTIMTDRALDRRYQAPTYDLADIQTYIAQVLRLEAVACKDWLTNKVDRCVGGRVAKQQCVGPLQLPLNDCAVMALDFEGRHGVATSIGHAPISGLIDAAKGARNAIGEALTNLIWAPLEQGLTSVSLSANWMWPCRNEGEDARLYQAVESVSNFCIELGINVPTGKDSLSMKQKYPSEEVLSPGTVIISTVGHCHDITRIVEPVLQPDGGPLYYINLSRDDFKLGGSSFAQTLNVVGSTTPDVLEADYFARVFDVLQQLILQDKILAGHDVSAGGLLTTLLEMCFPDNDVCAQVDLSALVGPDLIKVLFAENCGIVFQAVDDEIEAQMAASQVDFCRIGNAGKGTVLSISAGPQTYEFDIPALRDTWYQTSWLFDKVQTGEKLATYRFENYKKQPLQFQFPSGFSGRLPSRDFVGLRPKAAVLRDQGSNSERELANALYLAGFEVKDVHMTDLISGRETLEDIRFLGAVGGFSNSDVLGSAKGWAGSFLYNDKAKKALDNFFSREDVLSIGICNGCQLFVELELINPEHSLKERMTFNESGKHESAFTSVHIIENNSVMLSSLSGANLGVWISHGEGKFVLPEAREKYHIAATYSYDAYPSNPNGSDYNTAMMASKDGRHLVTMPHIERSIFQWNWAHYPGGRRDDVSPWIEAFINARDWLLEHSS